MLQYYIIMKTKNKMKDFDVKSKEWQEVAKELKKNLAHHKIDKKILRYKLEVYQRNFLNFVYGSLISTKASSQNEEIETRPNEIAQKEEVHIEEPQTTQEQEQVETIIAIEVETSNVQPLEVEPHIELVEEVKIAELEVGIKPLVFIQVETRETIVEKTNA